MDWLRFWAVKGLGDDAWLNINLGVRTGIRLRVAIRTSLALHSTLSFGVSIGQDTTLLCKFFSHSNLFQKTLNLWLCFQVCRHHSFGEGLTSLRRKHCSVAGKDAFVVYTYDK